MAWWKSLTIQTSILWGRIRNAVMMPTKHVLRTTIWTKKITSRSRDLKNSWQLSQWASPCTQTSIAWWATIRASFVSKTATALTIPPALKSIMRWLSLAMARTRKIIRMNAPSSLRSAIHGALNGARTATSSSAFPRMRSHCQPVLAKSSPTCSTHCSSEERRLRTIRLISQYCS